MYKTKKNKDIRQVMYEQVMVINFDIDNNFLTLFSSISTVFLSSVSLLCKINRKFQCKF